MSEKRNARLARVYGAESAEDLTESYDDWAAHYDEDLLSYGYRLPAVATGLFGRYVQPRAGAPGQSGHDTARRCSRGS